MCNYSTREAEAGGISRSCQPGLHSETLSQKKKNEDERMIERKEKYCMLYMYVVIIPS